MLIVDLQSEIKHELRFLRTNIVLLFINTL